jgi:hypothetical protein
MTNATTDHKNPGAPEKNKGGWLAAMRAYIIVSLAAHLVWEIGQLPFYTLWTEGTFGEKAFAIAHCLAGDLIIAIVSLVAAMALCADRNWPRQQFWRVGALTLFFGVGYTVFSEWINLVVRKSWAYSELMPTLPPFGTGLTPLLQWMIVPALALFAAKHASQSN